MKANILRSRFVKRRCSIASISHFKIGDHIMVLFVNTHVLLWWSPNWVEPPSVVCAVQACVLPLGQVFDMVVQLGNCIAYRITIFHQLLSRAVRATVKSCPVMPRRPFQVPLCWRLVLLVRESNLIRNSAEFGRVCFAMLAGNLGGWPNTLTRWATHRDRSLTTLYIILDHSNDLVYLMITCAPHIALYKRV